MCKHGNDGQSSKAKKRVKLSSKVSEKPFKVKDIERVGITLIFSRKGRNIELYIDRLSAIIISILIVIIVVAIFLYLPPLLELISLLKYGTSS